MSGEIKSFRDLIVWQKAMDLKEIIYTIAGKFPPEERYALSSQIRRAAVSIPSNIAEGYGRRSTGDYLRFLQIALGSAYELETQLDLTSRFGWVDGDDVKEALELCTEIEKMLIALSGKLRNRADD